MSNRSKRRAEERANNNEAGPTGDAPEGTEGAGDAPVTGVEEVTTEAEVVEGSSELPPPAEVIEIPAAELEAATEVVREAKQEIDAIAEEEAGATAADEPTGDAPSEADAPGEVMEFVEGAAVGPGIPEQFYALLKADEGFAQTWFHNLAMAFRDEGCPALVAQRGAAQFMGRCGVDVTGAEWFKSHMAQF